MIVKAIWEFDADMEGFDPEFVNIKGLAKDSAKRELQYLIDHNELSADDFEYIVENDVPAIRDNLLVTAGARVAYMHDKGIIDIPSGLKGEDEIACFIARLVDEYLESDAGNFDIWLEEAIMKGYGVKDVNLCSTTSSS